ncbi:MAG: response regulator transcription factor [Gemmatimonadota bacterium]
MNKPLRVLILEDSERDAEMIAAELDRAGIHSVSQRAESEEQFEHALREFTPDVIVCDHALPQFNSIAALKTIQAVRPTAPMIVVSGALDERTAVACLRAGAEDIVLKGNLQRLPSAIESAIRVRQRLERLTPRQIEVLRFIAEGHTNREIARRLELSAKTIESHRGEVMKRLDVHDIAGVVRYAVRVGLVTPEVEEI